MFFQYEKRFFAWSHLPRTVLWTDISCLPSKALHSLLAWWMQQAFMMTSCTAKENLPFCSPQVVEYYWPAAVCRFHLALQLCHLFHAWCTSFQQPTFLPTKYLCSRVHGSHGATDGGYPYRCYCTQANWPAGTSLTSYPGHLQLTHVLPHRVPLPTGCSSTAPSTWRR